MNDRSAWIVGAFEHPRRTIRDLSVPQIHFEVARGALADAGLSLSDVDAYFCDSSEPGVNSLTMSEYMGLRYMFTDNTDTGGSSYLCHVGHAAAAIAANRCSVALCTMAGRSRPNSTVPPSARLRAGPERDFENRWGIAATVQNYGLVAMRHMHEFGTTSAQLAEIKVAASLHAQHNPAALLPYAVTVEQVLDSPIVSEPLHRLDCCVMTDGGGALVVVSGDVARRLDRPAVKVLGAAEAAKYSDNGAVDLTYSAAAVTGPVAFRAAGVTPADIDYVSLYDSFTISALIVLEDLGFCEKGKGGTFVSDGALVAPHGRLPFNTDGGGLCNNHPGNRGGMPRIVEAVRQLRGEAHPAVQVPDCEVALVQGTGGRLATRSGSATLILGRADT